MAGEWRPGDPDWVTLSTHHVPEEAHVLRGALEAAGITVRLIDQHASPAGGAPFVVRLQVPRAEFERARAVIGPSAVGEPPASQAWRALLWDATLLARSDESAVLEVRHLVHVLLGRSSIAAALQAAAIETTAAARRLAAIPRPERGEGPGPGSGCVVLGEGLPAVFVRGRADAVAVGEPIAELEALRACLAVDPDVGRAVAGSDASLERLLAWLGRLLGRG